MQTLFFYQTYVEKCDLVFCLWIRNKATDIPSAEETEIPKFPHQGHIDKFFVSQGVVRKEFVQEGKTVNANFIKEQLIASCSAFKRSVQRRSALENFSCCTIIRPPTKLQVTTIYHSPDFLFPPDYFLFFKMKTKLKTPLSGRCWDPRSRIWWIKEGLKQEFSTAFRKCTTAQNPVCIKCSLLRIKKCMCHPHKSSI